MPPDAARDWSGTCTFVAPAQRPSTTSSAPHATPSWRGRITGRSGSVHAAGGTPGRGTPPGRTAAWRARRRPRGGTPTQPGGTTAPGLAATSLKLAKRQTGSRLRGSVDVRERGSRLRVDALVRRTVLGQRRSGRVRVGRLVRSSVGPGRVAFALGLQAKARKVLRARRKLAVQVRITVTRPGASRRTWTRSVTLAAR